MKKKYWEKIILAVKTPVGLSALGFLLAGSIITISLYTLPKESDLREYYPLIMLVFLFLVLILGFFMNKNKDQEKNKEIKELDTSILLNNLSKLKGDEEIVLSMTQMVEYAIESLKINNPIFRKIVGRKLIEYAHKMNQWRGGILHINKFDSRDFLIDLYENAEQNVFSTSYRDFILHWQNDFGNKLIDAHIKSKAKVTRIFVFNNRNELTEEHKIIIQKQINRGISAKVYFDEEDDSIHLNPETKRDYTIIDDKVLGVTESFGFNNDYASKWHFNNENYIKIMNIERDKLLTASISIDKI